MSANIEKSVGSATLPELQEMAEARKLFLQREVSCSNELLLVSVGLVNAGS